jgi:hypothetical protein
MAQKILQAYCMPHTSSAARKKIADRHARLKRIERTKVNSAQKNTPACVAMSEGLNWTVQCLTLWCLCSEEQSLPTVAWAACSRAAQGCRYTESMPIIT